MVEGVRGLSGVPSKPWNLNMNLATTAVKRVSIGVGPHEDMSSDQHALHSSPSTVVERTDHHGVCMQQRSPPLQRPHP